jgi:hypothetical protein
VFGFRRAKHVDDPDVVQEARALVSRLVRAGIPDDEVAQRLRAEVTGETLDALARLLDEPARVGYPADRWRSLVLAAGEGRPAPLLAPEKVAADEQQRQLSLLTTTDGFVQLAAREPKLLDLERRLRDNRPPSSGSGWRVPQRPVIPPWESAQTLLQELAATVGPESDNPDPLLRSSTAIMVVLHHCMDLANHGLPDPFE